MEWASLTLDLVHAVLIYMIWRDLRVWWGGAHSSPGGDEVDPREILGEP